jgi:hypothetical protein
MATRAEELAKLLGSSGSRNLYRNTGSSGEAKGFTNYLWPVLSVFFVLFLLLLVVHYTITPIFKFSIGDQGYIPLSNTNDGQLVWTKGPVAADLSANVLKVLPNSFTVQMDVYVESQQTVGKFDRVLFYRARQAVSPDTSKTLMAQYPESNLIVRLLPDTNDLVVSAITLQDPANPETAMLESTPTILNVPVRQPFRITIVLLPQVLEVYLNGKLFGTKTLRYSLKSAASSFFASPLIFRDSVRVMNVQYWDRPLTSVEVRKSGPALPDASLFGQAPIPGAKCT